MPVDSSFLLKEYRPEPVLLWLCGVDGNAEFFSPSWLAFSGRPLDALLGQGWFADVHRDDNAKLAAAVDQAIADQQDFRLKVRLRRHDGDYVPFACDGVVRIGSDGKFAGLIGVCADITREERNHTEAEIAGRHFVDLLPQSDLLALAVDNTGRTLFFNPVLKQLLGDPDSRLESAAVLGRFLGRQGCPLIDILFPGAQCAEPFPARIESEFISACGGRRTYVWHAIPLRDYSGKQSGYILIGDDLTESRQIEEALRLNSRVFETTDLAMIITDSRGCILSVNAAFSRLTGYGREEAIGNNPSILQSGRHDQAFYRAMWTTLAGEGRWQGEVWDRRKDGTVYPKFLSIHALRNERGEVTHYSGVFYDISERKIAEERLTRLAHFDALTELPNRQFFLDKLGQACRETVGDKESFALLFLDLDHFKEVNDTLGHQAGDELLRETARRLRDATRSLDMVARVGGDEFVALLADIKEPANAAMVAQKILDSLARPMMIEGRSILVTPSIGIAIYPEHAGDPDTLLRLADEAMYQAKTRGRNGYQLFST